MSAYRIVNRTSGMALTCRWIFRLLASVLFWALALPAEAQSVFAYPKAGQLGTDLNRDRLWEAGRAHGLEAVAQVSVDDVWSALRFKAAA